MWEVVERVESQGKRGQDRVAVIRHAAGVVIAVADGAGGTSGGAEAADTLILWGRAHADRATDLRGPAQWGELLAKVDRQISMANGQTTAIVVAVTEDAVVGASVGDSAAWLIADDGRCDDLSAGQQHKPLLGTGAARPMTFERPGPMAGTLLVATDGLIKYASRPRMIEVARHAELADATRALIGLVRMRSGALPDDVAVVLCRRKAQVTAAAGQGRRRFTLAPEGEVVEEGVE